MTEEPSKPGRIGRRQVIAGGAASVTLAGIVGTTNASATGEPIGEQVSGSLSGVEALTFDVFGTVVDWRSSIIREGELLGQRKNLQVDWEQFADAWHRFLVHRAGLGDLVE